MALHSESSRRTTTNYSLVNSAQGPPCGVRSARGRYTVTCAACTNCSNMHYCLNTHYLNTGCKLSDLAEMGGRIATASWDPI